MKSLITLSLLFFVCSAQAVLETPAEVTRGYNACVKLLHFSPAQQAATAKRAGHPLSVILSSCRYEVRVGLPYLLREVQQYYKAIHHHGHPSTPTNAPTPQEPSNSCYNTSNCSLGDQCINAQCVHIGPGGGECDANGPNSCALDETCIDGVCHF